MGSLLITPIAAFSMKSELLTQHFSRSGTNNRILSEEEDTQIPSQSLLRSLLSCCCKRTPYRKLLDRAEATIERQLDIVKFVKQQKKLRFATLSTLSLPQLLIVDKLSQLVVKDDDSDSESNEERS